MLNPKRGEYMIDTASGSCGFPVHTIFKLTGRLFTNEEIPEDDKQDVLRVFGIDFDEKTVRVARTLNLIAGDGETNVLHLNTLDYERWEDRSENDSRWINNYGRGFDRLKELRVEPGQNNRFSFDLLMANPPFAGSIKEGRVLHKYQLGFTGNGKARAEVGREILFIERNLNFLKPGGRMAIVLPQGLPQQQIRWVHPGLHCSAGPRFGSRWPALQHLQTSHQHKDKRRVPSKMERRSFQRSIMPSRG